MKDAVKGWAGTQVSHFLILSSGITLFLFFIFFFLPATKTHTHEQTKQKVADSQSFCQRHDRITFLLTDSVTESSDGPGK